jgi:DegV family protein with EDD domain
MTTTILDAATLRNLFVAGARRLDEGREYLDSINVFPVPDGDTGSNMAATMMGAAATLAEADAVSLTLPQTARRLSTALRMEARGNSGIILSEFFHAFFGVVGSGDTLDGLRLAAAMEAGRDAAYAALAEPKEGTILTVIRKMATAADDGGLSADVRKTLARLVEEGREALARTPDDMPLLRENGVVDSGAHGFLLFWEGGLLYLKGEYAPAALKPLKRVFKKEQAKTITYRFCTEGLVEPAGPVDLGALKKELTPFGDSLIITGDAELVKVHIHTNEPEKVFAALSFVGRMVKKKAEDMIAQNVAKAAAVAHQKVRIVTDSTCDLPPERAEALGVAVAPLTITLGEESFADGIELGAEEFYHRMAKFSGVPRTSLPPGRAFMEAYATVAGRCDTIVGVYLSSALSGTWQAGRKWGEEFPAGKVIAFDSQSASIGLGFMVEEASALAASGADAATIVARLTTMREKMRVYITVDTLEHLARSGRIGGAKRLLGTAISLKPILTLKDGAVIPLTKGFGRHGMLNRLLGLLKNDLAASGCEKKIGVAYAGDEAIRDQLLERIEKELPDARVSTALVTPVIGAHVGPGALGVFVY